MERSIAGGHFEDGLDDIYCEQCGNCKRMMPETFWIGYDHYCRECHDAYWDWHDPEDERLMELRLKYRIPAWSEEESR